MTIYISLLILTACHTAARESQGVRARSGGGARESEEGGEESESGGERKSERQGSVGEKATTVWGDCVGG